MQFKRFILKLNEKGIGGIWRAMKLRLTKLLWFPAAEAILRSSYGDKLLLKWHLINQRNWFDKIIFAPVLSHWFKTRYLTEKDPDKMVIMQSKLMGGILEENGLCTMTAQA